MGGELSESEEKARKYMMENEELDMEVFSEENKYLFSGSIGKASPSGKEIKIGLRRGYEIPDSIQEKDKVKLVTTRQRGSDQLAVIIATVTECGKTYIYIAPEEVEKYIEGRKHFRIFVKEKCTVTRNNGNDEKRDTCSTADISLTGIRILSKEEYEPGERIMISGLRLVENGRIHTFSAEILRKNSQKQDGMNSYGCCFTDMTERREDMLCHDIFALELSRKKGNTKN